MRGGAQKLSLERTGSKVWGRLLACYPGSGKVGGSMRGAACSSELH